MQGLNVKVNVLARPQNADDVVGGSVRADLTRYSNVRARIANESNPTVLSMQGFEGKDLHRIILYGDHYPAIEREDIVVPISGRWAGARFKTVEVRYSSVLTGKVRAHIQLVCERLRYAHENEPESAGFPVAYAPAVTLSAGGLALNPDAVSLTYVSTGDPIALYDIIEIDDEQMLVIWLNPSINAVVMGRAYRGTALAAHAGGVPILHAGSES